MKSIELRTYILSSLLLAIGFIMHSVVPGVVFGVKFDFMLPFMFLALTINPTIKNFFMVGISGGVITALTTSLPGGQLPNMIDKIITMLVVYLLYKLISKFLPKLVTMVLIGAVGTIISGTVFLACAYLFGVIPSIKEAFMLIVMPTALGNMFITPFIYYLYDRAITLSRPDFLNN